jgi:O-antigen ligase
MGFLYKIKMAPAEIFIAKIDRDDHRKLWDHWRGYEANRAIELMKTNPSSFIIGNGYGSLINLKFKAPLASNNKGLRYISEIHNGYIFIFYKLGIIGLFLILLFIFNLYKNIYNTTTFYNVFIAAIAACYFFTTLTITGVFNKRDIIILLLGALLYFSSQQTLKENTNEN